MTYHHIASMSEADLMALSVAALDELKRRSAARKNERAAAAITYSQNTKSGTIVRLEDGTPLDRPAWFYLPFLTGLSKAFQPVRQGNISHYREVLEAGKVLKITRLGDTLARVRVGGDFKRVTIGESTIEGPITVLK